MSARTALTPLAGAAVVLILLVWAGYALILPGLSIARREPSAAEVQVATWLLHHSVPRAAKAAVNPLGVHPDATAITAGRELFRQKCEVCHAYDGGGKTELGAGEFPRPPALRAATHAMSDGEIFYHIRNGIRNTAMPAWNMPDGQVWQLVSYIRRLPTVASLESRPRLGRASNQWSWRAHYVGSAASPELSSGDLCALAQDADGECCPRSETPSRRDHSRSVEAKPAGGFFSERHRIGLRQPLETTLLQEGRKRLLSALRPVGRHEQDVARLPTCRDTADWWAKLYP